VVNDGFVLDAVFAEKGPDGVVKKIAVDPGLLGYVDDLVPIIVLGIDKGTFRHAGEELDRVIRLGI